MINISDLEDRFLQLYKQRINTIITRRQEDVKDQALEYSISSLAFRLFVE